MATSKVGAKTDKRRSRRRQVMAHLVEYLVRTGRRRLDASAAMLYPTPAMMLRQGKR